MLLADSYPLLNVVWTIIVVAVAVVVVFVIIWALIDNFTLTTMVAGQRPVGSS
jgi:hypothetical protein